MRSKRILDGSEPLQVTTYPNSPLPKATVQELCDLLQQSTTNWERLIDRASTFTSADTCEPRGARQANSSGG